MTDKVKDMIRTACLQTFLKAAPILTCHPFNAHQVIPAGKGCGQMTTFALDVNRGKVSRAGAHGQNTQRAAHCQWFGRLTHFEKTHHRGLTR